jgi:chromosome segregation ATPase
MAGNTPSEFRFNGDDQEPDSYYHEELRDLRIEKISQRVTLLTILLPCLMAVAVYFGYQNLAGKFSQDRDTGSQEIQRLKADLEELSKNFNEKLITFSTTLSTQDKDFGTTIEGRLVAVNQNIGKLQYDLKLLSEDLKRALNQNQDTIEKLKASKADKKSQAVAIEKINAAIAPLKNELGKLTAIGNDFKTAFAAIEKLENRLTDELDPLTAAARQQGENYEELQASLTELTKSTAELSIKAIDNEALALDVLILKKNMPKQAKAVDAINRRLDTLESAIDGILKISAAQKQSLKKVTKKDVSQKSGAAPESETDSTALRTTPKTITEKDLID